MDAIYRFFAEDRKSAADWRVCDKIVADRAKAVNDAHAAAKDKGKAEGKGKALSEMGISVRKTQGGDISQRSRCCQSADAMSPLVLLSGFGHLCGKRCSRLKAPPARRTARRHLCAALESLGDPPADVGRD